MFILICNFFFACEEKKEIDSVQEEWDFTAVWIDDCNLEIEITGGEGEYYLGMAQTGAGDNGWYGENCKETEIETGICHPIDTTHRLESVHQTCGGEGVDSISEGTKTLFTSSFDYDISYAIFDSEYNLVGCKGDDCRYYED